MSRARSEAGFTLPELIVAMAIGMATVLAVLAILETSMKQSNAVAGRVNATQRGRIAMDVITRQLRSQVCYSAVVPALVSATTNSVRFHVDLSDGSRPIEQREIVYSPTAGTVRERLWPGQGSPLAFPTLTIDRTLLTEMENAKASDGSTIPFFRYYAYNTAVPPRPATLLTPPLSATDLARVARIEVAFKTNAPGRAPLAVTGSTLQNEIYVRVADPNDPAPTPTCA